MQHENSVAQRKMKSERYGKKRKVCDKEKVQHEKSLTSGKCRL